jgi:hypothetical protein
MFQITRYEHPTIFVTSRRTSETYKFLVREDGTLAAQPLISARRGEPRSRT